MREKVKEKKKKKRYKKERINKGDLIRVSFEYFEEWFERFRIYMNKLRRNQVRI